MDKYITDVIYRNSELKKSSYAVLAEDRLYRKVADIMDAKEYLEFEKEISKVHTILEEEAFHFGFIEGIRFLLKTL